MERIRCHAGLGARSVAPGTVSAATSAGTPWQIEAAVSDFISALNDYNRELNGPGPSSAVEPKPGAIPRDVAYAVGEVVRMLREWGADQPAWRVETAWSAVLAGDIDDLREHLSGEEAALGG